MIHQLYCFASGVLLADPVTRPSDHGDGGGIMASVAIEMDGLDCQDQISGRLEGVPVVLVAFDINAAILQAHREHDVVGIAGSVTLRRGFRNADPAHVEVLIVADQIRSVISAAKEPPNTSAHDRGRRAGLRVVPDEPKNETAKEPAS